MIHKNVACASQLSGQALESNSSLLRIRFRVRTACLLQIELNEEFFLLMQTFL